jgi:NAD+ diphosphatase
MRRTVRKPHMGRGMRLAETVTFGGSGLNRAAELRADAAVQNALLARGQVLPIWRGKPLMSGPDGLGWLPVDSPVFAHGSGFVFLGLDEDRPSFACDISDWSPEAGAEAVEAGFLDQSLQHHPSLPDNFAFAELRVVMVALSAREAELAATGKALLQWHRSHRFCSACGAASEPAMAGWQRDCAACGAKHFPRTDPVVIMLITHGNRLLLGRNAAWPPGMYSCLAGFVEPGETLEAAVRREVFEESGVRVGAVRYLSSQPWPFPASLMLGCAGEALSEAITIDPAELEEARWVSREDMVRAMAGLHPEIRPARKGAIAHFLIENWLADRLN